MLIKLGVVEYIQSASSSDFSRHAFIVIMYMSAPPGVLASRSRPLVPGLYNRDVTPTATRADK
jgi:hypothetical protein